jgi:hypothetical protein
MEDSPYSTNMDNRYLQNGQKKIPASSDVLDDEGTHFRSNPSHDGRYGRNIHE